MKPFYEPDKIEVGLDEAGRGCLFGPVCSAGVIWNGEINEEIKDSKKVSVKKRNELRNYIEQNAISYYVQLIDMEIIEKKNILRSTIIGWHKCLDNIIEDIPVDTILVDGPNFEWYTDKYNEILPHVNINDGDNKYTSIAAASILAKTYRDEYIQKLVADNPELEKYDIHNNKGYGTQKHTDAIKEHGITKWHRKTFGICKEY